MMKINMHQLSITKLKKETNRLWIILGSSSFPFFYSVGQHVSGKPRGVRDFKCTRGEREGEAERNSKKAMALILIYIMTI